MAIVLELLSRKDLPIKHYKFDQDYVCVGRDFNNDLRLDDPYVCPSHMLVAVDPESGQLMVNDCQSINGIKVNGRSVTQKTLTAHDIIKIGRTRLRIIDTKAPLPGAMPLSELEENLSWLNQIFLTICLTLACLAYLSFSEYVNSIADFNFISILPSQLGQLGLMSIWPLGIAAVAAVVKKESHVVSQLNLTLLAALTMFALGLLDKVVAFNFQPRAWFNWIELAIFAAFVASFFWLSLFIAFHQPNKTRNIITAGLSLLVLIPVAILGFVTDDEFNSRPDYDPTLLAPLYNITPPIESEKFVANAEALFDQVDQLK